MSSEVFNCPLCKAPLTHSDQGTVDEWRCLTPTCHWGATYQLKGVDLVGHIPALVLEDADVAEAKRFIVAED